MCTFNTDFKFSILQEEITPFLARFARHTKNPRTVKVAKTSIVLLGCLFLLMIGCSQRERQAKNSEPSVFSPGIEARLPYLLNYPIDSTAFPRSLEPDGRIRGVESTDWTSGFYPGSLLYLYRITQEEAYYNVAKKWLPFSAREKTNNRTHDMGFKIYCSIGNAYEIQPNEEWKNILVESAETLSTRFNETTGCIKSWDFGGDRWQYPVIIDNMMNLEILFEACQLTGDSSFFDIAVSHATRTMHNHFREDNSSYHVLDYDPNSGEVLQRLTHQGYNAESIWSRGQAWGLYGFTMAYRYTQEERFLQKAVEIADFITNQPTMPADKIPYWDMADPEIPNAMRDASAAAVTASALLELESFESGKGYGNYAQMVLNSLGSEAYELDKEVKVPFLLDHSTGNYPKQDELDLPINYADYYFLEALYRLKTGDF